MGTTLTKDGRWPKQFGDFGENLILFLIGQVKNMKVALVDHVGADIIATDIQAPNNKYAISVKSRILGMDESKSLIFDHSNQEKLKEFSNSFNLIATVAFVICDFEFKNFDIFIMTLDYLKQASKDKNIGFAAGRDDINFKIGLNRKGEKYIDEIKGCQSIDYTHLCIDEVNKKRLWDA